MKNKGYCFECNEFVDYHEFEEEVRERIKGKDVRFSMIYCQCVSCGNFVSVPSIDTENQRRLADAYKKMAGLLTSSELRAARKKLGLTATEFAKELQLGEKTITRYENGAIQTPKIDQLMRIFIIRETKKQSTIIRFVGWSLAPLKWKEEGETPLVPLKKVPFNKTNFVEIKEKKHGKFIPVNA